MTKSMVKEMWREGRMVLDIVVVVEVVVRV